MAGDATHPQSFETDPTATAHTTRRRRTRSSAIAAGGVSLLLLAGLLASGCSATTGVTETGAPVVATGGTTPGSRGTAPGSPGTSKIGNLGSLVPDPDHPGELITLDGEPTSTSTTPVNVSVTVPTQQTVVPQGPYPTVAPTTTPATTAPTTAPPTTTPTTTPPTTKAPTTTTTAPTTKPVISTFNGPTKVTCPLTTGMINLSWETKNTTKVDLGISNPGLYKSYPGSVGHDDVPFPCSEGTQTYYLTAYGTDGTQTQKTIVINKA